jgi:hypothetical protein
MQMKGILLVVFVIVASGCAVSKDGIGPARRPPTAEKVAQTKRQLYENEQSARDADSSSGAAASDKAQPGILVIGTTGPLRNIEDKDRAGFFAAYQKVAEQWHPGVPPALDAAAFQAKLAGWASIQTFGIPGIMSFRMRMLVPTNVAGNAKFASAAGSFLFGTTGDLVAASSDGDGLLWLQEVLCHDDNTYHECSKDYTMGVFDSITGQELDRERKLKLKGKLVDVSSFRTIEHSSGRR